MNRYASGLHWLINAILIPAILCISLALGSTDKATVFPLISGVFAYGWMLTGLLLAGQRQTRETQSTYLAQAALFISNLSLGWSHTVLFPSFGWVKLAGVLALLLLISGACYSFLFCLVTRLFPSFSFPNGLKKWLNRLNFFATILVFIHVQLLETIHQNLPFMLVFYLVTGVAIKSYLTQPKSIDQTAPQAKEIPNRL